MPISDLDYPEVQYDHTALVTVVCQVRFNPILRIGQELPAEFQERIRGRFPRLSQEGAAGFQFGPGPSIEAIPPQAIWRFKSEDECWTLSLTVDFMALESADYVHFEDFAERFTSAKQALESVYDIDHYLRVGLRYINLFSSEHFPGDWSQWFKPALLGALADPALGPEVRETRQKFVLAQNDWVIAVVHGTENGSYRLDIDHATTSRVEGSDVPDRIKDFNKRVYQVFRWAISDEAHAKMGGNT